MLILLKTRNFFLCRQFWWKLGILPEELILEWEVDLLVLEASARRSLRRKAKPVDFN